MKAAHPEEEAPDLTAVAPALEEFKERRLFGDLWKRSELTPRDRSVVTLATVIARNQAIELPDQLDRALDNGVDPQEISEIITHLAFYSGWGNAMLAVAAAKDIFEKRVGSQPK